MWSYTHMHTHAQQMWTAHGCMYVCAFVWKRTAAKWKRKGQNYNISTKIVQQNKTTAQVPPSGCWSANRQAGAQLTNMLPFGARCSKVHVCWTCCMIALCTSCHHCCCCCRCCFCNRCRHCCCALAYCRNAICTWCRFKCATTAAARDLPAHRTCDT